MPKQPVTNLHGIRIELQETERHALETYLMSSSVKNVGEGIGAIAKPILDNLTVIMAALIAREGFQWLEDKAAQWQEDYTENRIKYLSESYAAYLASQPDPPVMTLTEYEAHLESSDSTYRKATWWQENVGNQIRKTMAFWGGLLSPGK
jgi:hypothetical protein